MNTKRAMKWSLLLAAAGCVAVGAMPGCELLVTFDRSKIPDEGGSADGTVSDGPSSMDSSPPNETGPALDASLEAMPDVRVADVTTVDSPREATGGDAAPDTSVADAPSDTGTSEASSDSGTPDVAVEAAVESGVDAAQEAAAEGGAADAADDGGSGDDGGGDAGVSEAASDSSAESSADDGGTG